MALFDSERLLAPKRQGGDIAFIHPQTPLLGANLPEQATPCCDSLDFEMYLRRFVVIRLFAGKASGDQCFSGWRNTSQT